MIFKILSIADAGLCLQQTLGSHPSNDIIFPEKAADFLGTITLEEKVLHLEVDQHAELYFQNERIDELTLSKESSSSPSYISHQSGICS